jgi:hypothetical protein
MGRGYGITLDQPHFNKNPNYSLGNHFFPRSMMNWGVDMPQWFSALSYKVLSKNKLWREI